MNQSDFKTWAILIILLIPTITFGQEINGDKRFEFVRDYVEGLGLLKSSFTDAEKALNGSYDNEFAKGVARIQTGQSQIYNLEVAKNYLKEYQNSSDKLIKEVSNNALFIYDKLIEIDKETMKNYKHLYSPEAVNNPSQINLGEEMGKVGKLLAVQEEVMESLILISKFAPAILISKAPGEEGVMLLLGNHFRTKE